MSEAPSEACFSALSGDQRGRLLSNYDVACNFMAWNHCHWGCTSRQPLQFSKAWNGNGGENANANQRRAVDQKGAVGTKHSGENPHLQMT